MLFNSIVFIFYALPVFLIGYFAAQRWLGHKAALIWLIAVSLFFYGSWDIGALFLLCGSAIFNYGIGRMIAADQSKFVRLALLWLGLFLNIALLSYFKYFDFIISNINASLQTNYVYPAIILPLAISFFTFQKIAYLLDVYNRRVKAHGFLDFTLFVFFFPQLVAGPIVHHSEMMPQFERPDETKPNFVNIAVGIVMFTIGLIKKVYFADTLAGYTVPAFAGAAASPPWSMSFFEAWAAVIGFSYQIYFDFSAYSDMALGIALMFNIRLPINFSSPFKATNFIGFWRRWHMTLTRFLTDYIYTQLSLRAVRRSTALKAGKWVTFVTSVAVPLNITFLVSGIWHGAGWNYIMFGIVTGVAMTINYVWRTARMPALPAPIGWALTMFAFFLSIAFFRSESLSAAWIMVRGMLGLNGFVLPAIAREALGPFGNLLASVGWRFDDIVYAYLKLPGVAVWLAFLTFVVLALPNAPDLLKHFRPALDSRPKDLISTKVFGVPIDRLYDAKIIETSSGFGWIAGALAGFVVIGTIVYQSYLTDSIPQFIYFQF